MKGEREKKYKEPDFYIIVSALLISLFGLVMVFSSSYYIAISKFGNPYSYLLDDMKWFALGWLGFVFFAFFDYHKIAKWAPVFLGFAFILLLLVFSPLGMTLNNATRWLNFKIFTVMPGEVIKTALIVFLSWFYSEDISRAKRWWGGHLAVMAITGAAFYLIYKQPNLSTAGIVVMLSFGMMFCAGISGKGVLLLLLSGVGLFFASIFTSKGKYMLDRVSVFLNPFKEPLGDGWQVVQSLLALGSGGVTGLGLGKSVQKTLWLPEAPSDFIGSIVGEELGYLGMILMMSVYLFLIWRCVKVALRAPDLFGMLLAAGVAIHIALHVILNIAVISATFAPTGVVLPLISLGGNATGLFLAEIGMTVNISRQGKEV